MNAIDVFLEDLKENGIVENSQSKMQTYKELYDLLKYKPGEEWIFPNPKQIIHKVFSL